MKNRESLIKLIAKKVDDLIFSLYLEDEFLDLIIESSYNLKINASLKNNDTVVDVEFEKKGGE